MLGRCGRCEVRNAVTHCTNVIYTIPAFIRRDQRTLKKILYTILPTNSERQSIPESKPCKKRGITEASGLVINYCYFTENILDRAKLPISVRAAKFC